jgi:amino acid transporter
MMATVEGERSESTGLGTSSRAVTGEAPTLFARKATGLVRDWSIRDSFIFACLATTISLAFYEFTYGVFIPKGQLITSVLITGVWVSFLCVTYAGLIVTIPRAGGDYVWQSRVLDAPAGFVLSGTAYWFIIWLWAPIYGYLLNVEILQPIAVTLGHTGAATWMASHNGIFVISLITVALAGLLVYIGMSGYAKVQKWCFVGGMIGFVILALLMLVSSHQSFINAFDREGKAIFHVSGAYAATQAAGAKLGDTWHFGFAPLGPSMLLVPMMIFYLMWPNWGSPLYGEIRGASDFKRVFAGMFLGLWTTVLLSVVFLLLTDKTIGWSFYNNANATYWAGTSPIPVFPYPVLMVSWLVHNSGFQVFLILLMSLWFFGFVGNLFLGSTRVMFAAAFDRVLPDAVANVSGRRHVPLVALVLMLLPAMVLSALYSYWGRFSTYTLDAVLVVAVSYFFTSLAAFILPWRKPDIWKASAASRFKVLGVPLVQIAAVITMGLLGFNIYEWLTSSVYGVNNRDSLIYMGLMYVLAVVIYVVARLVRRRQGIDLGLINKEIPSS